jgi:hypothetical protein
VIYLIAALALGFVLLYLFEERRRGNEVWQRFRQRHQMRRRLDDDEETMGPTFQLEQPPADDESRGMPI